MEIPSHSLILEYSVPIYNVRRPCVHCRNALLGWEVSFYIHMEFLEILSLSQVFQNICFPRNPNLSDSMLTHAVSLIF